MVTAPERTITEAELRDTLQTFLVETLLPSAPPAEAAHIDAHRSFTRHFLTREAFNTAIRDQDPDAMCTYANTPFEQTSRKH